MRSRFISQPFDDGFDLRDFLRRVLKDPRINRLDIAVAWARRSGLRVVENELRDFRSRGGFVRMIVGISQGGATKQGLEFALELADEVSIFHDPSGRTFHVKVYVAYDTDTAEVLVGSHNFTGGGTIRNYEAGSLCELNLASTEDQEYLQSVCGFFDRLLDDEDICVRLDDDVLSKLVENPTYQISDEDSNEFTSHARDLSDDAGETPVGTDARQISDRTLFGRSKHKLRPVPRVVRPTTHVEAEANSSAPHVGVAPQAPAVPVAHAGSVVAGTSPHHRLVIKRWYKELDEANAQQPSGPKTHPTGHLTLTQNSFPIDHKTYFRNDFFGNAAWKPVGGSTRERVNLPFEVVIHNMNHAVNQLDVDHNPAYVSSQGNRATTIRWGPVLSQYLRAHDHVGDTVTMELLDDGSYRITIDDMPTGPFIP